MENIHSFIHSFILNKCIVYCVREYELHEYWIQIHWSSIFIFIYFHVQLLLHLHWICFVLIGKLIFIIPISRQHWFEVKKRWAESCGIQQDQSIILNKRYLTKPSSILRLLDCCENFLYVCSHTEVTYGNIFHISSKITNIATRSLVIQYMYKSHKNFTVHLIKSFFKLLIIFEIYINQKQNTKR